MTEPWPSFRLGQPAAALQEDIKMLPGPVEHSPFFTYTEAHARIHMALLFVDVLVVMDGSKVPS